MEYWSADTIRKIREGFYSAVYFDRTRQILVKTHNEKIVTMQIFQKKHATLCGIAQVSALFTVAAGYFSENIWKDKHTAISISALPEGSEISPFETVMHITGPYAYFAHLESLYLGILARQTKIATNTHRVIIAAKKKHVIFFADRFDYFLNQEIDGYAAKIGGVHGVATPAQASLWKGNPSGTIPHALIAINNGNTLAAADLFQKGYPEVPLIVLVDYQNDCVNTSLEVARKFGKKLWGVRLDTSELVIDVSLQSQNVQSLTGVQPKLVSLVRTALDREGFTYVKIVVSGGFTAEKITAFEKNAVPVDAYGVGSSLLQNNIDFTADIVVVDGIKTAKEGRALQNNIRLIPVA